MPKTNEKDAYYFPHDCNARNDPKILALRSVFGAEGYGIYWMLIEILREQPDYKLQVTKYIWNTLAMQMQVQKERLQEIVDACCTDFSEGDSTLLINDGAYLFSDSLLRRMGRVDDISKLRREAARKRWENQPCKVSQDVETEHENASALQMQSKEKKRKEKQSRAEQRKADIFSAFAGGDDGLLSALHGFEQMRNKSKKPMTDEAKKRMLANLEKLSKDRAEQIDILHQSEDRCWMGLFPLKDANGGWPQQASSAEKMDALRELHGEFCNE
ncbi:MAG: DUF4373 domain-containing protein [Oscillospiraceae bacterium]